MSSDTSTTSSLPSQSSPASDCTAAGNSSAPYELTLDGDVVTLPSGAQYVYVERVGPFAEAARDAWTTLHSLRPAVLAHNAIAKYAALYAVSTHAPAPAVGGVYRACFFVDGPQQLPDGLQTAVHEGGAFARFTLTGSYEHLGVASGRVLQVVAERPIAVRQSAFTIEHYLNNPATTPMDKLRTEILIPTL